MTGIYVRAQRDRKWQNVEVEELTDEELREFFAGRKEAELTRWCCVLAGWIRDNAAAVR